MNEEKNIINNIFDDINYNSLLATTMEILNAVVGSTLTLEEVISIRDLLKPLERKLMFESNFVLLNDGRILDINPLSTYDCYDGTGGYSYFVHGDDLYCTFTSHNLDGEFEESEETFVGKIVDRSNYLRHFIEDGDILEKTNSCYGDCFLLKRKVLK